MNRLLRIITYCIAAISCAFIHRSAHAQNLVTNGDFERFTICPTGFSQLPMALDWVQPTSGTSDYYNACAGTSNVGVPNNIFGYQPARSGQAYGGLYGVIRQHSSTPFYQEFMSTKLSAPLQKDSAYCVTFYASPTASGIHMSGTKTAANSIGILISDTMPRNIPKPAVDPSRFILNDTSIHLTDTSRWYEIRGLYLAKGGEQWITIGVFFDGTMPPVSNIAPGDLDVFTNYFYIDDVSVTPSIGSYPTRSAQYCNAPLQLTANSGTGPYRWSTGESTRAITVSAPGRYHCVTPGGCSEVHDTVIVLPPPLSDTVEDRRILVCSSSGLDMKLSPPVTGTAYKWSTGDTSREIRIQTQGSYFCDVLRYCRIYRFRFEVEGNMPERPVLRDTSVCRGTEPPVLQTGYDDLVWYTSGGTGPFTTQPVIPTREAGQVLVYASRKAGDCITPRQPLIVTVISPPKGRELQNLLRCNDRETELMIGARTGRGDLYTWSSGESSVNIPIPVTDGQYIRTATNPCGFATDTFNIRSGPCNDCVSFPNAFTPNADGLNDEFRGMVRCEHTEYFLRIYNRWGEMVFVTSKPETGWDGTHKGIPAPTETYMYQCTLRNVITGEQQRVQGDVLLIR